RLEMPAISSIALKNASSLAFDGLLKPLIFLTNCREAARTSSSVTGGSKLKRVLIFLHMRSILTICGRPFFVFCRVAAVPPAATLFTKYEVREGGWGSWLLHKPYFSVSSVSSVVEFFSGRR